MAAIYVRSGAAAHTSPFSGWATAAATLPAALAVATATDTIWMADDHSESSATALALVCPSTPGLMILCANTHVTAPPTGLATTASVATTGSVLLSYSGYAYVYGVKHSAGSSSSAGNFAAGNGTSAHGLTFDNCAFTLGTTNASSRINFGPASSSSNNPSVIRAINPTFKFGSTSQSSTFRNGRTHISSPVYDFAGSIVTTLFTFGAGSYGSAEIEDAAALQSNIFDVSAAAGHIAEIRNSTATGAIVAGTRPEMGGVTVRAHNVTAPGAGTTYAFFEDHYLGSTTQETTIVRSGGAGDGVTSYSYKIVTTAKASAQNPYRAQPPFWVRNTMTGSPKTTTVEIVHDSLTALKDNEVWLETEVLDDASNPLAGIYSDRAASVIAAGTNQASSAASWTAPGMTNPNTQKLEVTATPAQAGYIRGNVLVGKASYTLYADQDMAVA